MQLNGSVGLSGKNKPEDVRIVQGLLNTVPTTFGGPEKALDVDGFIGPKTVSAITRFQNKNFGWGDGRVDVGGKTLSRLADYADGMADPKSPLAAMAAGGQPLGNPSGGTIDNETHWKGEWAKVTSIVGNVMTSVGPINSGNLIAVGTRVWTGTNSSASFYLTKSAKSVFLPAGYIWWAGKGNPVPTASVQWTKSGNTTPAASGKPAPYVQAGKPGVSPGYFRQ